MYQSTEGFGKLVQQDSRTFKALISVGDSLITDGIKSIKLIGGSNSEEDFSIGSAVSQYVEITMAYPGFRMEGKEFLLQIGLDVGGLTEYVPMGYFTSEKPKADEEQLQLTAYDRMAKTERPCFLELPEKTDSLSVLKAVGATTSVQVVTAGLTSISMQKPVGYTCREVLSIIAQMYGGFAICNRQGQIEIRTYQDSGYTIGTGRYWDTFTHNDYPFLLEKLTCYTGKDGEGKDISVSAGDGAREVSFSNAFMTQAMLDNIWQALGNYSYMPGTLRFLGDPRIDPWDILTVVDRNGETYKVPAMKLTQEYDAGLTTIVEAVGKSEVEQESGFKGPNTQQMERMYAQLVLIDHAMVNKLDVDTAKITYATITNLNATNAVIENLSAEYGNFKSLTVADLNAAKASIGILEADSANIRSLLSGNAGIGDLQNIHLTSANAVIESALIRNAVMETVSIADLLAGDISTNRFRILSDDGGILIQGATQQWRDKNGVVRMQAGRDANGDFTFALFNESGKGLLLDHTGVKPGAIADGLIVNDMVAGDANISGSKLDIASVIRAMNGSSETLNSSRIWFDEQNQSLTQLYAQMNTNITTVQSTATAAKNTADAAKGTAQAASNTAQKALNVLNGISTLDALGASLDNDAHVVHTNTDGSGGDYSECHTKMTVYLGDTDVSDDAVFTATPSAGVTGRWDEQARTFYVAAMAGNDGYVDIDALCGTGDRYLTTRKGNRLMTRAGKYILVKSGGSHIRKRFSISKAPDGRVGLTYSLRCSTQAIRKQKDGKTLIPSSVTFSAVKNDNGIMSSYSGRYKVEESTDGTAYAVKYQSAGDEVQKIYTPSAPVIKSLRCTLYSAGGTQELDSQTVIVLADAEGLAEDIAGVQSQVDTVKEAIVTTNQKVTNIETGVEGIRASLSDMTTDLHGLTDNTLLFNVKYHNNENGTTTLTAVVYKDGQDVTASYSERWFTWYRRTESGDVYLGYGRNITVENEDYTFGGVCVGRFTTYGTYYLTTRSGNRLLTRAGNPITIWKEN